MSTSRQTLELSKVCPRCRQHHEISVRTTFEINAVILDTLGCACSRSEPNHVLVNYDEHGALTATFVDASEAITAMHNRRTDLLSERRYGFQLGILLTALVVIALGGVAACIG